jgi:H+-transporting ATPase
MSAVAPALIIESASKPDVAIKTGLSRTEARRRRAWSGLIVPHTLPDT